MADLSLAPESICSQRQSGREQTSEEEPDVSKGWPAVCWGKKGLSASNK